jgi:alpha-ketoglutaric semialdehyde dehydrogenase
MPTQPILIAGAWRLSAATQTFTAQNPATGETLPTEFPISPWSDVDQALTAAAEAFTQLRTTSPENIAAFLEAFASEIEAAAESLIATAHAETALPTSPRLKDVELPRTTTQLRQAAAAAREGTWTQAVIDTKNNIRSHYAPIGPIVVFGPNNFPFAFNAIAGGDLAAAIAAGNPVLAKSHPLHPATSQLLAQCAHRALQSSGLPPATIQMLYHLAPEDGLKLVADPRTAATAFTGSRPGGLALKAAADRAGKPIYLEMSSLNPIVLLPGALTERGEKIATELADSALAASGQFCTSPNLVLAIASPETETLAQSLAAILASRKPGPLLSASGLQSLDQNVQRLIAAGANPITGATPATGEGFCYTNTLLRATAAQFLSAGEHLQIEAFGNSTLLVTAANPAELQTAIESLEGNLTGSIYSATTGEDDALYTPIAFALRPKVGRLLNDKMPTGVALSPAMNHGGPYPATANAHFTAVGIPRSILRFTALHCYDNVQDPA